MIEKADAVELGCVHGEVEICGLSFAYGDMSRPVLDGVDLHIKAGETIALVGPSGGGKTTLAKLLLRLYEPLSGECSRPLLSCRLSYAFYVSEFTISIPAGSILIDGCNIENIKFQSLRRHNFDERKGPVSYEL